MVVKYFTLYYDPYEKKSGDGFYPYTKFVKGSEGILTGFKFMDGYWKQVSGSPINGFGGNEKNEVLKLLNDILFQNNIIVNNLGVVLK